MTKLERLEARLRGGSELTSKQIKSMFGLQNPTAAIHTLRSSGVCVYANKAKLSDGTLTTKYRVGNASKNMIAMLHALGAFA